MVVPPAEPWASASLVVGGRTVSEPRLSPDARQVLYNVTWGASVALVLRSLDPAGPERILTTDPASLRGRVFGGGTFAWCPDGSAVVYAAGDGNLWRQSLDGRPPTRLTDQPKGEAATGPTVSPDNLNVAFVVGTRDIWSVPIDGVARPVRLSSGRNDFAVDPSWSADSRFVAWHEWDVPHMAWDESRWVVAPASGSGPIASFGGRGEQVTQPRFAPVGSDLAFLCDRSGWLNLWVVGPDRDNDRPLVDEPFEHGDPTWGTGQRSFVWSPDGRSVAFNRNEDGFGRLSVVDVASRRLTPVAKAHHGSLDWQGNTLVAVRSGGVTPHQIVAYDMLGLRGDEPPARTVIAIGPPAGAAPPQLREPEPVTFPARDGVVLHGRLYRPEAPDPRRPLICWIHGGPTDQWPITFQPRFLYWLARGWTILVPDHRGSTGHGRAYTQAMAGRWGELDVVDVGAALDAAIENDWCASDRIAVMGGSAGGFTALNLALHDNRVAAVVAVYPVTDLEALATSTHRFEAHYTDSLAGSLPDALDTYRARSVVRRAAVLSTPTLVLHGTNDEVVPVAQSEELAAASSVVELHIYDGEGHGWRRPETTIDEFARVEAFLTRHVLS